MKRLFYSVLLLGLGLLQVASAASTNASRSVEPYPTAASKKGLQVQMVDDAITLGVKHAGLNIDLAGMIDPQAGPESISFEHDGKTYAFKKSSVSHMDRQIRPLSEKGVLVNLIVLVYESKDPVVNRILLHPQYDKSAPNHLGAFNSSTEEGRQWLSATLAFMAERWSRPDKQYGRVVGYIMGNEVNSHWYWSNMGKVTMEEFAADYHRTVRLVHNAIRRECSWGRVYLSLEHHWNIRYAAGDDKQAFAGRLFLDHFAKLARAEGDFDWHLAFHPYPEDLFNPRFWKDKTATTNDNTPRITFKNLQMLNAYMCKPEMLFQGASRRIILSEQGFHSPAGPEGDMLQAAAYCYAYKIVEKLDGIDSFILHRHVDHPHEGGLLLGVRFNTPGAADPMPKKKSYDCFRLADTPQWESAFEFALPVVGLKSWKEIQ